MRSWHYTIPPDLAFVVRTSRSKPELLSRTFGPEAEAATPVLEVLLSGPGPSNGNVATVRSVYKAIPWTCQVSPQDDRLALGFQSAAMREYLAMHIALLPALRHLLAQRNAAMVLGAAYEIDGAATIIAGPTGTGKTSLLLGALQQQARFVGDEYISVSSTGQAGPIVRSLALRRSTLALAPEAADWMSGSRGLALRAAEIATKVTGGRLEPLNHVRPEDLGWTAVDAPVPIERVVWLATDSAVATPTLEPMPAEDMIQQFALRQAEHQVAYGDITPYLDAATRRTDTDALWRDALTGGLRDTVCLRLSFSRKQIAGALDRLLTETLG